MSQQNNVSFSSGLLEFGVKNTNFNPEDKFSIVPKVVIGLAVKVAAIAFAAFELVIRTTFLVLGFIPCYCFSEKTLTNMYEKTKDAAQTILDAAAALFTIRASKGPTPPKPSDNAWYKDAIAFAKKELSAAGTFMRENKTPIGAFVLTAAVIGLSFTYGPSAFSYFFSDDVAPPTPLPTPSPTPVPTPTPMPNPTPTPSPSDGTSYFSTIVGSLLTVGVGVGSIYVCKLALQHHQSRWSQGGGGIDSGKNTHGGTPPIISKNTRVDETDKLELNAQGQIKFKKQSNDLAVRMKDIGEKLEVELFKYPARKTKLDLKLEAINLNLEEKQNTYAEMTQANAEAVTLNESLNELIEERNESMRQMKVFQDEVAWHEKRAQELLLQADELSQEIEKETDDRKRADLQKQYEKASERGTYHQNQAKESQVWYDDEKEGCAEITKKCREARDQLKPHQAALQNINTLEDEIKNTLQEYSQTLVEYGLLNIELAQVNKQTISEFIPVLSEFQTALLHNSSNS